MTNRKPEIEHDRSPEPTAASTAETAQVEAAQAVENAQNFANEPVKEQSMNKPQKSGGKGIAFLALLVALGVGGAGYYFGEQKLTELKNQVAAELQKTSAQTSTLSAELPNFEAEKTQLAELAQQTKASQERIEQLSREQGVYTQQINGLQNEIQKIRNVPKADNSAWLLSDAHFLLNNALRKLVLDQNLATAKALLIQADEALSQLSDSRVLAVREAIKADLNQLANVHEVDQNSLMLDLTRLANRVDDLPLVSAEESEEEGALATGEVSDTLADWEKNLEKSAASFLDHFIRISDKATAQDKAFIAPNQEIYLRENLRLRLQIATLAVPRQQNTLYKQSLDTVGTWVRSYFDEQNDNVKAFLKDVDTLSEQSIYVDVPKQLQSLTLLEQILHKAPQKVEKVEMEAEKSLEQAEPQTTPAAQPENAQ